MQFLQSCTIIFSPLAAQINTNLIAQGVTVDETDPSTWAYYLNLSGQYHSSDTVMYIKSLDTHQSVEFTTTMLASSPKTAAAYTIGSSYYKALCQTYPTQIDLIKSILYPVDLETALASPDFTLLGWGEGYLESTEEEAIIQEINKFLTYASSSWYFEFFNYECYYIWTFWASIWQTLPNVIFAARLKYLKTSYVHSFHIWSYLESKGISDYSDILSRQQALFLYRNIEYLIENRGTQSNLILLVDNILDSLAVGLVGKTIYMNTATNAATCQWTPEFVSTIIPTVNSQSLTIIAPESMTELNADLIAAGLEINDTTTYIDTQQTKIGNTILNTLPTKIVEIQKLGIDQKYGSVLCNFLLDTLVSMITQGKYIAILDIIDPTTNIEISLSAKDALALYYYVLHRSIMEQPIDLPVVYVPTCAFQYNINIDDFPSEFTYNGFIYPTSSKLDISSMISGITYPSSPIIYPSDFSTLTSDLFLILIQDIRFSRTVGDFITLQMFLTYMKTYVLQTTPYTFTLSEYSDYTSWAENNNLTELFTQLDANYNYQTAYSNLATAITSALIPFGNSTVFSYYGYTPESVNDTYDRIKELFIQLCSYNITFLDTDRTNTWWFLHDRIMPWITNIQDTNSLEFNPVTGIYPLSATDTNYVSIDPLDHIAHVSITSSNNQLLTENDIVSVSSITDTNTILNPFNSVANFTGETDTTQVACHKLLRPVFVSSTTTST